MTDVDGCDDYLYVGVVQILALFITPHRQFDSNVLREFPYKYAEIFGH